MKKQTVAAITVGVWLSAFGSAAALIYALNRPAVVALSTPPSRMSERPYRHLAEEPAEPPALELPTLTIVGELSAPPASSTRQGVTEMQGQDRVIVGPGVVTHPR